MMYYVSGGSTSILIPEVLQPYVGIELVELGAFCETSPANDP